MDFSINEKQLDEKLAQLEKARTWSPRVISKLEAFIRTAEDDALFRINPVRYSTEKSLTEEESIDLFLHGVKLGLFRLNWQLWCPGCGGIVESFDTLKTLGTHYHCNVCQVNLEATLDDFIEITFTISEAIRPIRFHHPETLSMDDYFYKYIFHSTAYYPDGTSFGDSLSRGLTFYLEPGQSYEKELTFGKGVFSGADWMNRADLLFQFDGSPVSGLQTLTCTLTDKGYDPLTLTTPPGTYRVQFVNQTGKRGAVILFFHPENEMSGALSFPPNLSGKRLLNTQTFRDLFRAETIGGNEGIGVKDITILFTDLKGSTALYDRIGDLKAFHLVRQHFDSLGKVINRHQGVVVKTIGDAVMATFLQPSEAVIAAIEMLEEIERFNESIGEKDIILKIGIHKGSSIAVTLNERLDYFGQTVNIAARVQGLAGAEEIYLTEDIYKVHEVKKMLTPYKVRTAKARLKGIQDTMRVYRVRQKESAAGKAGSH